MSDSKYKYLIYTDSAADLPYECIQKYDLRTIPMEYIIDGRVISFDTGSPDHDRICNAFFLSIQNGAESKTTQISEFRFIELLEPALEHGNDILYLCFSSGLSGTYNNACLAADELRVKYPDRKIIVIDTLAATMGQGIIVRAALLNRENGMSLEKNASWLRKNRYYNCHRFMVGDLHYLHKGGRLSSAAAVVGSMLKIKPVLVIDDEGKLQVTAKARGLKLAKKKLLEDYQREFGVPDMPKIIHIGHTSLYEEAEALKETVAAAVNDPETSIDIVNMGPIIGTHVGPELLAVCGWGLHRL